MHTHCFLVRARACDCVHTVCPIHIERDRNGRVQRKVKASTNEQREKTTTKKTSAVTTTPSARIAMLRHGQFKLLALMILMQTIFLGYIMIESDKNEMCFLGVENF